MWKMGREDYLFDFGPPIGKYPSHRDFIEDVDKGVRILQVGIASRGQPDRYLYIGSQLSFAVAQGSGNLRRSGQTGALIQHRSAIDLLRIVMYRPISG
jgi:hypothetical protein